MEGAGEAKVEVDRVGALLELSHEELRAWLEAHSQPPMRARQVRGWILAGRAEAFEQMTDPFFLAGCGWACSVTRPWRF